MEIQGYENYLIYEDGRVWSKTRKIFLKPAKARDYLKVALCKNGKYKQQTIHRLIAIHYIPNPNNYYSVDHIDRNKINNNINNLRWADRKTQQLNRNAYSNTGEKYICKYLNNWNNECYKIAKNNCFYTTISCSKYTLQDAINLRDSLLSMEDDIINHSI